MQNSARTYNKSVDRGRLPKAPLSQHPLTVIYAVQHFLGGTIRGGAESAGGGRFRQPLLVGRHELTGVSPCRGPPATPVAAGRIRTSGRQSLRQDGVGRQSA